MSSYPNAWLEVELSEIADVIRGVTYKKENATDTPQNGFLPVLRATNITGTSLTFDALVYVPSANVSDVQLLRPGDVVIASSSGSKEIVGKSGAFLGGRFVGSFGAFCTGLRPSGSLSPDYFGYYFQTPSYRKSVSELSAGSNINNLKTGDLAAQRFPLPPAAEQTRIVAKLEELLSDLDAGVAELKAAQKKLKQYRQSLLKAAVTGALTADWRETQRSLRSAPLSPRGRGAGGEGEAPASSWLTQRARTLRREQTPAEQSLWYQLRAKRFSGFKFRRQQPIGRYIVDFVCFERKLIIELDGGQHAEQHDYDQQRDDWLRSQGFTVLRFWNNEWTTQSEPVLEAVWRALQQELPPLPNPSPTRGEGLESETGGQLLQRILSERRARWEDKQLARFKAQGKTPPTDWQKKYPEPVQPDTTGLPELPEGWVWASLSQLGEVTTGFTPSTADPANFGGAIPFVKPTDLDAGYAVTTSREFLTEQGAFAGRVLPAKSVLVTCIGATIGKLGLSRVRCATNQQINSISFDADDILPEFVYWMIASGFGQSQIIGNASATTFPILNKSKFERLSFPLPPTLEQQELVEQLERVADKIAEQVAAIDHALTQSTAQRQNILRAAFAGQLVPQDPNDEPASVLLARIRAERAAGDKTGKLRARKTREPA